MGAIQLFLITGLALASVVSASAAPKPLNICILLADDWRADCMSLLLT